jgi:hypothetical protein
MRRLRRRHTFLLILLLLLLSISRRSLITQAPAEVVEPSFLPPTKIVKVDAYPTPVWKISDEDFWALIQPLFHQHAPSDEPIFTDSTSAATANWGGFATDPASPAVVVTNAPQTIVQQNDFAQPPILFWPDQSTDSGELPALPVLLTRNSSGESSASPPSLNAPPQAGDQPPGDAGQLPPTSVPEPAISILFVFLLIPLRRRT